MSLLNDFFQRRNRKNADKKKSLAKIKLNGYRAPAFVSRGVSHF